MSSDGEKDIPAEGAEVNNENSTDVKKSGEDMNKVEEKKDKKEENDKDDADEDTKEEEEEEDGKDATASEEDVDEKENSKEVKKDKKAEEKEPPAKKEKKKSNKSEEENESEETVESEDKEEEKDEKNEDSEPSEKPVAPKKRGSSTAAKNSSDDKVEIPEGSGTQLGEIPRIDASISRFKNDDLKLLHRLLFRTPGKTAQIKKNIRKFNGFSFKKDSDEFADKLETVEKFEVKQLKIVCEMLDLEKKGSREDMSQRILEFLIEPKDSGKGSGGGRPKRASAVRANNRGYSSHDESYSSDEKHAQRSKRNAGRKANYKDDTSSESDAEFRPSGDSEEEKPKRKRGSSTRGKKKVDSEPDEEASDAESNSESDSEGTPKSKKKKVSSNSKPRGRPAGRGRGRKPGSAATTPAKKTPVKRGRKKETSEEENEGSAPETKKDDVGSSSEDEPLAKKTAKSPQPPTDEEIKTYVKKLLEGANLEVITMKTVCKQVYAHYPDFDLTHKKDYIKTTVKSLIST